MMPIIKMEQEQEIYSFPFIGLIIVHLFFHSHVERLFKVFNHMHGKGHHNMGCICKDRHMKGLLSTRSIIFRLGHETKFILHHSI